MPRAIWMAALLLPIGLVGCGGSDDFSGTAGSGGAGGAGGAMFEPGPTCIAFCAKVVGECNALAQYAGYQNVDEASCQQGCEQDLSDEGAVSAACAEAVEAVFLCASELDCANVRSWLEQEPVDSFACRPEVIAATNCVPN